jgi:hypothetical protein
VAIIEESASVPMRIARSMPSSVQQQQLDLDVSEALEKLKNQGRYVLLTKGDRCRDSQPASRLGVRAGNRAFGVLDVRQNAPALPEINPPFFGQGNATGRPAQQPDAEGGFKICQRSNHRRL